MSGPGFMFWGVYVGFVVIVAAYVGWMYWTERKNR